MYTVPRTEHRWRVLGFAITLAVVTYVDRIAIAQAQPMISRELGLNKLQFGMVFAAFGWAYSLFEMPSGFLGDWLGCRKVLLRIVLWWSFFTMATGWAWNFSSLVVTRFLFGVGEAGAFPNLVKSFDVWLEPRERTRAQGLLWLSARWGGALTPLLVVQVLRFVDWRGAFGLFGLLGVVWAVCFWWGSKVLPEPPALRTTRERVPWEMFVRSRQVWLLVIPYFTSSYGWWFYITWLPAYLRESRHVALEQGALLAGMPLFIGGLGSVCAGYLTAPLTRWTGSLARARKWLAYVGYGGAAVMLVTAAKLSDPVAAMVAMSLASFANDLVMPGAWSSAMDVGGKFGGTLSGAMGGFGNAGGAVSPLVVGLILHWTGNNWELAIYISAAVYFAGAFCWMFLDPVTPLEAQLPRNSKPSQGSL